MLSAATEQFSRNPFAGLVDNTSATNPQQGTENREPLPNPWSSQPRSDSNAANRPRPGVLNNSSMASLLQQMAENPQLAQNMFSAPYTQSMIQALAADPNISNAMLAENPLFAGNPALQEQMRTMMPHILQQIQNPEMQALMSNPQVDNYLNIE